MISLAAIARLIANPEKVPHLLTELMPNGVHAVCLLRTVQTLTSAGAVYSDAACGFIVQAISEKRDLTADELRQLDRFVFDILRLAFLLQHDRNAAPTFDRLQQLVRQEITTDEIPAAKSGLTRAEELAIESAQGNAFG